MVSLSVVIIVFNEEKNLGRCLASVKDVADEVIVVDSLSTDRTVEIAENMGARVIQNPFDGYGEQKNFATRQAMHDWVLSLDADEELTPELSQSILQFKKAPEYSVYEISRLTSYCGQWIRHSGWYPDRQTRLYDRTKGYWVERKVHEYWTTTNNEKMGLLSGDLRHYSYNTITEHLQKIEKYSELSALEAVKSNKDASLFKVLFSPLWHFIYEYFFRLGFLDGFYGYIICKLSAYATFSKLTKTRMYIRARNSEPV